MTRGLHRARPRSARQLLGVAAICWSGLLAAQSSTPPATPGPGQAPAASAPAASAPAASAPAASAPAAAAPRAAAPNPHAGLRGDAPRDESAPAGDLPVGALEAVIVDPSETPLPRTPVRLAILFQNIAQGDARSERLATTGTEGRVRFEGLKIGSEYSYRIHVKQGPAEYASGTITLGDEVGHRARLHVFPVTTEIASAAIGMRGFVYIEPRDDVFQFEVLFRVFNVGAVTWVPGGVLMKLPAGFKAFNAPAGMSDVGFEVVEGEGARLKGTISPGQHDANFRFQVAKAGETTASFGLGLLPRVAEMRVIVEASSKMSLKVQGFEEPQVAANQQGKRVLVTRRLFGTANDAMDGFVVDVSGLPVPGPGRWIAVFIALGFCGLGLAAAAGRVRLDASTDARANQDLITARELLLREIVKVEKLRRDGDLGPRAYADARRILLESLARLGRDVLTPASKKPSKSKRAAAA